MFQSVVLQMKECTDRVIGVIDVDGNVVACNDLPVIGEHWPSAAETLNSERDAVVVIGDRTFKSLSGWRAQLDFAVFVQGNDEQAKLICNMAAVALNGVKSYYEEKYDKAAFVKNIISDNILLADIYVRAEKLHFAAEAPRAVFLVRPVDGGEQSMLDVIQALFPNRQNDFVFSISDSDVVVVKQIAEGTTQKELYKLASSIEEAVSTELKQKVVIGIGTVAEHIRDLARAYKEAQTAIEVGKVFDAERSIINYDNLGIGRLIYQLPITLCEMFLQEVFKKNPIDALDQETLFTINKFFENNLNVSETARKLFVHRNTLVYRLEKIKKLTGLDLREFDDAITFKVALMVKKYLLSRGITN
jgi:carbohydrate diacid regulator